MVLSTPTPKACRPCRPYRGKTSRMPDVHTSMDDRLIFTYWVLCRVLAHHFRWTLQPRLLLSAFDTFLRLPAMIPSKHVKRKNNINETWTCFGNSNCPQPGTRIGKVLLPELRFPMQAVIFSDAPWHCRQSAGAPDAPAPPSPT